MLSSQSIFISKSIGSGIWYAFECWQPSVGGVMVSIDAFQALDPGSIPGHRNPFMSFDLFILIPIIAIYRTFSFPKAARDVNLRVKSIKDRFPGVDIFLHGHRHSLK